MMAVCPRHRADLKEVLLHRREAPIAVSTCVEARTVGPLDHRRPEGSVFPGVDCPRFAGGLPFDRAKALERMEIGGFMA